MSEILKVWVGLLVVFGLLVWLVAGTVPQKHRRKVIAILSIVLAMLCMYLTGRLSR